jgi:hypothetical protein
MIRTRLGKLAGVAVALVAGGAFALVSPAQPAVAFFSGGLFLEATPLSPATLVAKGAAVDVPVDVICNATYYAYLSVQVTERVGKGTASGFSSTYNVPCTGSHQTLVIRVTASQGSLAFTKGTAVATAYIQGCGYYTCGDETRSVTITIQR